ncbi:MAG: biopolymer transporter ExbD [Ferruginibacter sp.]
MAEINTSAQEKNPGVKKSKKLSTRVDLTPMVDLGFLLITFFVFTTNLAEPKAMNLLQPANSDDPSPVCESCAFTVLLGAQNKLYYFKGSDEAKKKTTNYQSLRQLMLDAKRNAIQKRKSDQLSVIIKPGKGSSLKNLVDVIDEVNINAVKRYFIDETTEADEAFLSTVH